MSKLTLEQVAKLAGVSRSTVSRVVRNQASVRPEVRERIQKVIQETGYQPHPAAQMLAGQSTNIIGLVIGEPTEVIFDNAFFPRLIQGVAEGANQLDLTLTLFLFHDKSEETKLTRRILQNQLLDGLIVSGTYTDDPFINLLAENNLPFIVVGRHENPTVPFIDVDNVRGAETAVTHLIELGYRRIGTITGHMKNRAALDRLVGYKQALVMHGYEVDEFLIGYGDFTKQSGFNVMLQLLEQKVDAVFAASDSMAVGAIDALKESGVRVPQEIAIVGYDDSVEATSVTPALTTMRQPVRQSGMMAVEKLFAIIDKKQQRKEISANHDKELNQIYLPAELIVRASSALSSKF
ncbi:LacI family transcriptional regulator [Chloroflexi bacterium TSY]|nr:LacI family transcriptional regulator [Chloroflexi bacterium TSY]